MDVPKFTPGRRKGNTTRLADWYIQGLFENKSITVSDFASYNYSDDDYNGSKQDLMNEHLFIVIVRRLQAEHEWDFSKLKIDKNKLTITWKNK